MTNGGVISEGMEADVVIRARVYIEKVDEAGGRVQIAFGDDVNEPFASAWMRASNIHEVKAVTASAELFVSYWQYIRDLVEKAAGDQPRDSRTNSILKKIDEIIDPKWVEARKAKATP